MDWFIFGIVLIVLLLFDGGIEISSIAAFIVELILCIASEMSFWLFIPIYAATFFVFWVLENYINIRKIKLRGLATEIIEAVESHKEIGELNKITIRSFGVNIEGSSGYADNIIEYKIKNGGVGSKLKFLGKCVYKQMDKETFDLINNVRTSWHDTGRTVVKQSGNTFYAESERSYTETGDMEIVRRTWHRKNNPDYYAPKKKVKSY